jgi:hypothetical protein
MIPAIIFATMRRSGSHFCMHRSLASVVISDPVEFGLHVNSIGSMKLLPKKKAIDQAANLTSRKQNHYYTAERRAAPRTGDEPIYAEASYACLSGHESVRAMNPSGFRMKFLAINIEDETVDMVAEKARGVLAGLSPFVKTASALPIFVTLRSLRSIALSRRRWLERKGENNIMASGFRKLDVDVWRDHYESVQNGRTKSGVPVVGLHYGRGVETAGQAIVDAFKPAVGSMLDIMDAPPPWIAESVLSDGSGSSFVGSGASKGASVRESLKDRAPLLAEFDYLFEDCPEAMEHAEEYGEL